MIEVIKYLDPLWYFNIKSEKSTVVYFPDYTKLSEENKQLIDFDFEYEQMSLLDAAFQAFKKGIFIENNSDALPSSFFENIPVTDLYRFTRKYYSPQWSLYFLIMRLLAFHHPGKELSAFFKSRHVKKNNIYTRFSSEKTISTTSVIDRVSLILPTLNRHDLLVNILNDLAEQTMKAHEVIVIDQSDQYDPLFYQAFEKTLPLQVIYQKRKGQWHARNEGIRIASGDYLLFVDDDSRVAQDWIAQHLAAVSFFKMDISTGISLNEGNTLTPDKTFFHYAEEFDTGNVLVHKDVFKSLGGFDEAFNGLRMGDAEFGMRAYLQGFKSISNPLAGRIHVKTTKGGLRDWGSVKAFTPVSFWGRRPDTGVFYYYQKYFRAKYLCSFLTVRIFISFLPSKGKSNWFSNSIGFLAFVVFIPWWVLQLVFSFQKVRRLRKQRVY